MADTITRHVASDRLTDDAAAAMNRTRDFARKVLAVPKSEALGKSKPKPKRKRKSDA
jgi:hypothetical protein